MTDRFTVTAPKARRRMATAAMLTVFAAAGSIAPTAHANPYVESGKGFEVPIGFEEPEEGFESAEGIELHVALSADGKTMLVGSAHAGVKYAGAALVYVRSGEGWQLQQTLEPKLGSRAHFGWSVALSADGNTAVIGAPGAAARSGDAEVYVRSAGAWTKTASLSAAEKTAEEEEFPNIQKLFGYSVAISGDGDTLLIGGPASASTPTPEPKGGVWAFSRSGNSFTQLGTRFLPAGFSCCHFGASVALSSDGGTALARTGEVATNSNRVWAFARSGTTYAVQSQLVSANNGSVAIASDGNTGLVESGSGQGLTFTRSGEAWGPGPVLSVPASFYPALALSADGATAILGGENSSRGVAQIYRRSGEAWGTVGVALEEPAARAGDTFGEGLALSADGKTAVVTSQEDGEIWTFEESSAPAPTVTKSAPGKGPAAGGATVRIIGTNLTGATEVRFGSVSAPSFHVVSSTQITATTPAHVGGTFSVAVTTAGGTSSAASNPHYKFVPAIAIVSPDEGSSAGGAGVTVSGSGFTPGTGATTFKFGSTAAGSVVCPSSNECTMVTPAHHGGAVKVKASAGGAVSGKSAGAAFIYH
jgi:hypothetical protein